MKEVEMGLAGRLAKMFINSSLTPLLILIALLLGIGATVILPREEEPQITVPMADVFVAMPGASAHEVEQRVTYPMEKLIRELPGVEYVYSTSRPGSSMVIVRFLVGTPTEDAVVRLYNKLYANFDLIPPGTSKPLIKSRAIDDVPIMALTFSSPTLSAFELRQVAAQVDEQLKQVDNVSETTLLGGQRRQLRVELNPGRLSALNLSTQEIAGALQSENQSVQVGNLENQNRAIMVRTGNYIQSADDLASLVVAVRNGKPVRLKEVAQGAGRAGGASLLRLLRQGQQSGHRSDPLHRQASRRQRHRGFRSRQLQTGADSPSLHPFGRGSNGDAQLWRNRRRTLQRTAGPYGRRGGFGHSADLVLLGKTRIDGGGGGHPGHPGPDACLPSCSTNSP
jgi:hypothetical protein